MNNYINRLYEQLQWCSDIELGISSFFPIAEGKFRKAWSMHIVWGTLLYSLMYFIPIFLSVYFGTDLVQKKYPEDLRQ